MAIKDTVLPMGGGADGKAPMFVPKGQVVAYSVYTMHRREDYFGPDADEFRPERWDGMRPGWEVCIFPSFFAGALRSEAKRLSQRRERDNGLLMTVCFCSSFPSMVAREFVLAVSDP